MSLWSHRDFRRLWVGDTISQFGSSIGYTVVPLLAAGALAATPFEMGVLSAATTAAFLVIGLPAGVWVDRLRRRPVMLTADLVRAALLLSVPVAWWAGVLTLAQLVVVSLLVGAATVMFDVAYQSYLPALVGRDQLVEGNTKLQTSQSVAHVSGPSLAGFAAQAFGAANGVLATGVGYLVSAWALLRIRTAEPEPDRAARTGLAKEIGEGLRFVFGDRSLRAIALCTATANFFGSAGLALQVLFLTRHLDLSEGAAGLLLSVAGAGGLLGAVTAGWWTARFGQIRTIWLILLVTNPLGLLIPLAAPDWRLGLFVVGELAVAYGGLVYNIAQLSYRQARCPDRLLGRMNASIRFVVWGVIPLGGLLGGALGGWIGIVPTLWIGFGGQALAGLWVFFSPLRGQRDLAEAQTAEPERSPS
ncbi:MFS transporter [Actinosynnema pretiosum subsp. pretiosum]|uniref:Major facilitator superfamily MFS_1 n=2 Tax=Actinosynnema TaxID=40566 RepID=C6WAC2_ACTMD|nr:MFS transporter [Actinosynnema mirum]ACU35389.1 major facilitator superfamily MFS_1 [Actinosynnema mirum DSM 43827]AXX28765.1 major facilitator superfamily MFS_1 [Actinosynnema pretiosum subsp. pretiosum]QUF06922.1 MFS transporter [Actinosynnema pretiosum subsp. pretiosum]